jgi:prepilin-type N-terminal cleavage/methylation domain-containing protein
MSRFTGRERDRARRGFSIIELMVAMMLVAIGLLSLVGANTVFVRRRNDARQRLAAVAAATNRLAQLAGGPCTSTNGASGALPGIVERWSAVRGASAFRDIEDSVRFGARPAHAFVLRTRLPC